jgi:hypothetical protein
MIRESKIKELINDKIVSLLENEFKKYGFKFVKSKKTFSLQYLNEFTQIISIFPPYSPISYDEKNQKLYLVFISKTKIEIPKFEKWSFDKLGYFPHFSCIIDEIKTQFELTIDDFDKNSFFQASTLQQLKKNVSLSILGYSDRHQDTVSIEEFIMTKIPLMVSNLNEKSDILKLKETNSSLTYINLLVYGGYLELAKELFKKKYDFLVEDIPKKLIKSKEEAVNSLNSLNYLIKNCEKIINFTFDNPFERKVKVSHSKFEKFEFSKNTTFLEKLRLDISQVEIQIFYISSRLDILIFTKNQKLIKLNSLGELVFQKEIESNNGFSPLYLIESYGEINKSGSFYLNNYIITNENIFIELNLPKKKIKKGNLQHPGIADFAYSDTNEKYYLIYENNFYCYDKLGNIEKNIIFEQKLGKNKIVIEKEWIVTQKRDHSLTILDFNGKSLGTFDFSDGNNRYEFSSNFEYLICHFYSTKSQIYNLITKEKDDFWAHPTYIKNYKNVLYNDVEHNFGLSTTKFSPDNEYFVGGAYHGKYIACLLPSLERIELIPDFKGIEQLLPRKRQIGSEKECEIIIEKAELIELENQTFLKNRNNDISNIFFFENGDIFLTEIAASNLVFSWDRTFKNINYFKIDGKLNFHSQKYLSQQTDSELIIYVQK